MRYDMVEMIGSWLDPLFTRKELYDISPFSVDNLRDNLITFIIKDAYAQSEIKQSLRANRGNDDDSKRMQDSRNIAYSQHYRNLQYKSLKDNYSIEIPELLPTDVSSMEDKIDGHKITPMQYFELNTIAEHPIFKAIVSKRICDVKKISNDAFIEYMEDYDNLVANLIKRLDGNDEDVIFATIALFTLEWKYNVELFYTCAREAEKIGIKEVPSKRLVLLCGEITMPLPPTFEHCLTIESRYVLHRSLLIPYIFSKNESDWNEVEDKLRCYLTAEYYVCFGKYNNLTLPEFFNTHINRSEWANFFRKHYDMRTIYNQKEWTNKRIRYVRKIYEAMIMTQPTPSKG